MAEQKVLIIDDEPGLCWALEKSLREEGYDVLKAASGSAGLELLSAQKDVSLVLLDYKMPGMDGLEVLDKIMAQCPGLPVLFMTGHSAISTAAAAIKIGAVAYVTKPFHLADLKETVRGILQGT
jgi:DNA-binding NtrC family response regulator